MKDDNKDLVMGLKQGMRLLASGIAVITTKSSVGERAAMTASSVTSVSTAPPSLLVCVNTSAHFNKIIDGSNLFAVNILAESHEAVSAACAKPRLGETRFDTGKWIKDETNLDVLEDAPAVFICEKSKVINYGTHNIYIGNVVDVRLLSEENNLLVYANGAYHSISSATVC